VSNGFDLIASIIREGGHSGIKQLKPELFLRDEKPAYDLLMGYYLRHGELPPFELFARNRIDLPETTNIPGRDTSFNYNFESVCQRAQYNIAVDSSNRVQDAIKDKDINLYKEIILESLRNFSRFDPEITSFDASVVMEEVWEEYKLKEQQTLNRACTSILAGWEPLDRLVGGYGPGDLIVFSGRRGAGKSYMVARQVLRSVIKRHRVVFVTMEMTAQQMARRLAAIHLKLDPTKIKDAALSAGDRRKFNTMVDNFDQYPIKIIEGNLNRTVTDLIAEAREYRPDIVFIDGSYLLISDDRSIRSHWEKQASIHQSLKTQLAIGNRIPVVCSVQQNRASKTIKDGDGIVAGSDVIEQLASVLVSVQKVKGNKYRRRFNLVKNRDGPEGVFIINYIFNKLDMDVNVEDTRKENEKMDRIQAQQDHNNSLNRNMRSD